MSRTLHIGGASGYWGESDMAWAQLLGHITDEGEPLDYLVFDYLAEITMSLLARMRARDPCAGYAPDFVARLSKHLPMIAAKGVKVISNAGGVNPVACAQAVRTAIDAAGLSLTVAVVTGDDLMERLPTGPDMFTGEAMPQAERVTSANAYLGAWPVAAALACGADIVITGRCVDSAVTLGALMFEFGWNVDDFDRLAAGSLVGHLIECGPQVTGGNFTDWEHVPDPANIGYPVAEVSEDGSCVITKSAGTGGVVNRGTVAEQMLYEIGDPARYILPDVVCDFRSVVIEEIAPHRVRVSGAVGAGRPARYKTSVTIRDGYRMSALFFMVGAKAEAKAQIVFDAVMIRARGKLAAQGLPDYTHAALELLGNEFHYGEFAQSQPSRELAFRISVRHADRAACVLLLTEASGFALATPPGLSLFTGARPKPQEVVRLFSTLVDKVALDVAVEVNGDVLPIDPLLGIDMTPAPGSVPETPPATDTHVPLTEVPLVDLAWLRSGDKGDLSNIGVAARKPDFMPYIWAALSEPIVAERFAHLADGPISRWYLPGSHSMNILIERALGGGGMASLRNDPQGKGFAQVLAQMPVAVPQSLL